jgi:hypothetical protein
MEAGASNPKRCQFFFPKMIQRQKTLLIDNYDSFTFNVAQALSALGAELIVFRNDQITVEEILSMGGC